MQVSFIRYGQTISETWVAHTTTPYQTIASPVLHSWDAGMMITSLVALMSLKTSLKDTAVSWDHLRNCRFTLETAKSLHVVHIWIYFIYFYLVSVKGNCEFYAQQASNGIASGTGSFALVCKSACV